MKKKIKKLAFKIFFKFFDLEKMFDFNKVLLWKIR